MSTKNIFSIVVLVLNVFMNVVIMVPAVFLVMATDGCHEGCPLVVVEAGIWIAILGPWIVFLLSAIFSIKNMVHKLDALSYTLIGISGSFGAFLIGVATVFLTELA